MKIESALYGLISRIWDFIVTYFDLKNSDFIERQRFAIFLLSECGMVIIGISATCFYRDIRTLAFYINNVILIVLPIVLFLLYYKRVFSLSQALFCHIILYQATASSKIIYAAITSSNMQMSDSIIILDMTLLLSCFLIAYLSQLRYINIVILAVSLVTYVVAIYISKSVVLWNFLPVFCIMFALYGSFASIMGRIIYGIFEENKELKIEYENLAIRFSLNKRQLDAWVLLTRKQNLTKQQIEDVMSIVGDKAKKNMRNNMRYLFEQERINYEKTSILLPELSQSEIEICNLILKGKKLLEISEELGKTETNISSQRSHIRSKLGLLPQDNLREALKKRMNVK